jgi:hypothetical protein
LKEPTAPTAQSAVAQEWSTIRFPDSFKVLESGEGKGFFDEFSDDVDWIVEGTRLSTVRRII